MNARVAELRSVFDQERAAPFSASAEEQTESLIAIRVSRDAYAIKVSEISGLATGRKIVAFPSVITELLGVAGIRGALVPVYSLAALLGYAVESEQVRWLALCGNQESFALAFNELEGYVRVPRVELYSAEQQDIARPHVTQLARTTGMVRAVISIPLLRETIQGRCRKRSVPKEQ